MSRTVRFFLVDAFTDTPARGNPAGVALDAERLSDAEMQRMASEVREGDWAFVLPPASADEDLRVRFFSPRKELPFVGHATLAVHAVLATIDPRPLRRQGSKGGLVEVRALPGSAGFSIRLAPPAIGRRIEDSELREVLELFGLAPDRLDPRCPPCIAGGTSTRLLLGLRDAHGLDELRPRLPELAALSARLGAQGYFLYTHFTRDGRAFTESRMFCPALGIDEDPVSGNAHAMLGVYLHGLGLLPVTDGVASFTGLQGRHVNRAGEVRVDLAIDGGSVTSASIAGQAVIASRSEFRLA
jgi:PhzF family phenazine biosynthesis protein